VLTPVHDLAGNTVFDPLAPNVGPSVPAGQWYKYDEENRVVRVRRYSGAYDPNDPNEPNGPILAQYEYDAPGRRIHTVEYIDAATGQTLTTPRKTRYVYVGLETIEEYDVTGITSGKGTLLREFLWGDPQRFPEPVAMVTQAGSAPGVPAGDWVCYLLPDVLGSVVGLVDWGGDLPMVERYTYDPYGRTLIEKWNWVTEEWDARTASAFGNPWMWTGQRYDAGTGLYAFLYRTYSPGLGRWMQRDPRGYADSVNLYEYAIGDPLYWIDALGLTIEITNPSKKCKGEWRNPQCEKMAESLNEAAGEDAKSGPFKCVIDKDGKASIQTNPDYEGEPKNKTFVNQVKNIIKDKRPVKLRLVNQDKKIRVDDWGKKSGPGEVDLWDISRFLLGPTKDHPDAATRAEVWAHILAEQYAKQVNGEEKYENAHNGEAKRAENEVRDKDMGQKTSLNDSSWSEEYSLYLFTYSNGARTAFRSPNGPVDNYTPTEKLPRPHKPKK